MEAANIDKTAAPSNGEKMDEQYNFTEEELYINGGIRIIDLIGLSKDELFSKLGEEYIITDGISDQIDSIGYKYPKYDIKFTFDSNDIVEMVYCYEKASINGAHIGMNISEIESVLGKADMREPDNGPLFDLLYTYESYYIWFAFYEKDGCAEEMLIGLWS